MGACPVWWLIFAKGEFSRHIVNGNEITAGVGLKLKQLTAIARNAGIGGFEWMEGIPGNLGGSLRMNAGAMGAETFEQVVSVRYCDQDGNIFTRPPAEMEVRYRDVPTLHQNYALSATLRGTLADTKEIETRIADSNVNAANPSQLLQAQVAFSKIRTKLPLGD